MRCDQFMGLNDWASEKLLNQKVTVREKGLRTFPDGRTEEFDREVAVPLVKREPSGAKYTGMFGDEYDLYKYTTPDGHVYFEFVQDDSWSSGPCFFLALQDEHGVVQESLWSDIAIDSML